MIKSSWKDLNRKKSENSYSYITSDMTNTMINANYDSSINEVYFNKRM